MQKFIVYIFICMLVVACKHSGQGDLNTFRPDDVELLESPFLVAQEASLRYMLEMDVDRLLAPFIREAGLTPLAESYGNWENTGLDGHIGGHYLSALSLMYAATGNAELLRRLDYMTDWLARCQEANGNGYVGEYPGAGRCGQILPGER